MRTPTEALKEIRDRLTYFCLRTDGRYDPPWAAELVGIIDETTTDSHAVGNAAAMRDEVVLRLSKDEYKGMQEALSEHDRLCEMSSESRKSVSNAAAMREALRALRDASRDFYNQILNSKYSEILDKYTCVKQGFPAVLDLRSAFPMANAALSAPPHKGKWENGTMYEYEYAYCSECGRMQWAGWDSHKQADEEIESFARDYKFCPGCGAEMEGGVYVY